MENFTEGVIKMCEMTNRKAYLLEYFLSIDDVEKALDYCQKNGMASHAYLWITFLNYLCTRENPENEE